MTKENNMNTPKLTKEQEEKYFEMTQNCVVPGQIDELPDDAWVSGWFAAMEHSKAFIQELERAREVEHAAFFAAASSRKPSSPSSTNQDNQS